MALTRRSGSRFTANIWPGFVDAMTALLLVLMFVLSIFMIVQSILRETVSSQETELDDLAGQVAGLAQALGLEQQSTDRLETQVGLIPRVIRVQRGLHKSPVLRLRLQPSYQKTATSPDLCELRKRNW